MVELATDPTVAGPVTPVFTFAVDNINVSAVPEPSAFALATCLAPLGFVAWRQHAKRQQLAPAHR